MNGRVLCHVAAQVIIHRPHFQQRGLAQRENEFIHRVRTSLSPRFGRLSWRTADVVRQYSLDVDALGDTLSIFEFNTEVTHRAIDLRMAK